MLDNAVKKSSTIKVEAIIYRDGDIPVTEVIEIPANGITASVMRLFPGTISTIEVLGLARN